MSKNLKDLTGREVNDGIDEGVGGTMMTGEGINFFQLLMIQQALKAQCRGFRLTIQAPQGTTLARKRLGLRVNKESLLEQVTEIVDRIQTERAADHGSL